jgi:hypothetical protein
MQDTFTRWVDEDRVVRVRRGAQTERVHSRFAAAAIHLCISLLIGVAAFTIVHFVWYPDAFWQMSGGRSLFFLVVSVDIVIGPLITLTIFNPKKSRRALVVDLAIIGVLQIAALSYGVWTIAQARPVFAVFNVDRVTVVTAGELSASDLSTAERPEFKSLPWLGPRLIAVRHAKDGAEQIERIDLAMAGRDVPQLPKYFIPYGEASAEVLRRVHPVNTLADKNPEKRDAVETAISQLGRDPRELGFLPTVARGDWVAVVDTKSAEILGYLPFNGF